MRPRQSKAKRARQTFQRRTARKARFNAVQATHTVEIPFETIKRKALQEIARAQTASSREGRINTGEPTGTLVQRMLRAYGPGQGPVSRWDVRCIARLIDGIPGCVPRRCRHAAIHFYMASDQDNTWIVAFDLARRR